MTISLENIGKRYNYEWIFRGLDFCFQRGNRYAILGPNGSGKSTLLQIVAGYLSHNEGSISYRSTNTQKQLDPAGVFRNLSLATPYLELIEEFTLREALQFHSRFKPLLPGLSLEDAISEVGLEKAAAQEIRYFSSGMKQRAKLAQAILADTALLLLDEPCTNLDADGVTLYQKLLEKYAADRVVIVSSNDPREYELCNVRLSITDYKD
jgi:ABC-type multidrug transport system ATPase subunit